MRRTGSARVDARIATWREPIIDAVRRCASRVALAALALAIAGCATRTPAPIVERKPPPTLPPPISEPAPPPAPAVPEPEAPPPTYTVKRGDTLHQIALDTGLDYRELAAWNNIENVNVIRVGQVLRLTAPGTETATTAAGVTLAPLRTAPPIVAGESSAPPATIAVPRNSDNYKSQPKALKEAYSDKALRDVQRAVAAAPPPVETPLPATPAPTSVASIAPPTGAPSSPGSPVAAIAHAPGSAAPSMPVPPASSPVPPSGPMPQVTAPIVPDAKAATGGDEERVDWLWPATGKLITGFSDTANLKGIDIAGKVGAPVFASAAGKVVYAGTGLRGYGKLVIVKHNNTYLSAYAHNSDILVKEGQQVTRGQKIAEMGNTDSDQVKLHFEIRRMGKPVDPLKYLPPT